MSSTATPLKKRFRVPPPVMLVLGLVVIVAIVGFFVTRPKTDVEPYRTQPVTQGGITKSVSSSGTLQALVTVEVGSQISGQLKRVLVDFDDKVVQGQVLAQIDPQTQDSRLLSARAELEASQQGLNSARANLAQTIANSKVSESDFNRTKILHSQGIVAPAALEQAQAKLDSARAEIRVSEASVRSAAARLQQSRATVQSNQIDLGRTIIRSPITGVVVDRKVDEGSTVAASLNAPVLFTIAQDLAKLELKILVDEADIGQVKVGQPVNFTVDAFPTDRFTAVITQVRKQPETQNNVVAYVVIAEAENPTLKLLPGMTANAEITLERHSNVLRVPTAALRWVPADQQQAPAANAGRGGFGGGFGGGGFGGPPGGGANRGGGGGGGGGGRGGVSLQNAIDQLDMTPKQMAQVETIMAAQRKDTQAAQAVMQKEMQRSGNVDRAAFQKQMRDRQAKSREAVEALLRGAQKAKLQQIMSGQIKSALPRGQVYVLRDGKPVRIGVGVGVTDGQNTQVVASGLRPGDLVIISGGPKPKATAAAGGLPRGPR